MQVTTVLCAVSSRKRRCSAVLRVNSGEAWSIRTLCGVSMMLGAHR